MRELSRKILLVVSLVVLAACASLSKPEQVQHPPDFAPLKLHHDGHRPLVAYVLGSGAARGFAHVGVLIALDRAGIAPDMIVGTSSGGLVGALYASGIRGESLRRVAMEIRRDEVIDHTVSRRGVIIGDSLEAYVNKALNNRQLQELNIPLAVVATDLHSGRKKVFTEGDSGLAVRAGSSFPGLFKPVLIGDREYIDGGVLSPVPVDTAFELGADVVIAVDVAKPPSPDAEINGWIDVLHQSYLIMARALSAMEVERADVLIRPEIGDMSLLDFGKREMAIAAGEKAAVRVVPLIRRIIREKSVE